MPSTNVEGHWPIDDHRRRSLTSVGTMLKQQQQHRGCCHAILQWLNYLNDARLHGFSRERKFCRRSKQKLLCEIARLNGSTGLGASLEKVSAYEKSDCVRRGDRWGI